jgi:hypothetical protein
MNTFNDRMNLIRVREIIQQKTNEVTTTTQRDATAPTTRRRQWWFGVIKENENTASHINTIFIITTDIQLFSIS